MMNKIKVLFELVLILILLTACTAKEENCPSIPTPECVNQIVVTQIVVTPETVPALYGLWMNGENSDSLLLVSKSNVYLVETLSETSLRESFYEIKSIDWANDVVTMSLRWVRINGKFGGFDYPLKYMKVKISEDSLFYSFGDEGQGIPQEANIGPFLRK